MKDCTNCNLNFESNKKNQKYCSPACCRLATNKKIMAKYYENKKRLNGEKRYGQLLSRYNENNLCSPCIINNKKQNNENILEVINHVIKKINKTKR